MFVRCREIDAYTKHTKPNKKKPNDQALEKLLDTPDSKKAAEVFRSNPWD